LVIAGTCEGKVNILEGSAFSGFEVGFRIWQKDGMWTGFPGLEEDLSVLFKNAILWVLGPSSFAGGCNPVFGVRVMCPDLSFICPCEGVKRGQIGRRYFFSVKIVNGVTCEVNVDWEGFEDFLESFREKPGKSGISSTCARLNGVKEAWTGKVFLIFDF
jgi:hypothetical protein